MAAGRVLAPSSGLVLLVTGAAVCVSAAVVMLSTWSSLPVPLLAAMTAVRVAASVGFLLAGGLRLARWRVTSDARSAYTGVALLVLGALSLPLFHLARSLSDHSPGSALAPATRCVGTLACATLLLRALAYGEDDSRGVRPRVLALRTGLAAAAALVALTLVWAIAPGRLEVGLLAIMTLDAGMVVAWAGLAVVAVRRGQDEPWAIQLAPLLGAMGLVELMRLLDLADPGIWLPAATVLLSLVALVTAWCAAGDLSEALSAERDRALALSRALSAATEAATRHDAWREELTHDLRNAVAGLRAALHTLEAHGAALDPAEAAQLRAAALDEVGHLEHLVETGGREEVVDFEVGSVVRTVVRTRRATGQDVRVHGTAGVVTGRPGDLATVLQNLLVNAGVHAPGSRVTVRLGMLENDVEIAVSDRGPGLGPAEAEQAFARGARGPGSPGSGLGLYVARSLMRKHGGDVELRSRVGGATFVVTLPAVERRNRAAAARRASVHA